MLTIIITTLMETIEEGIITIQTTTEIQGILWEEEENY